MADSSLADVRKRDLDNLLRRFSSPQPSALSIAERAKVANAVLAGAPQPIAFAA